MFISAKSDPIDQRVPGAAKNVNEDDAWLTCLIVLAAVHHSPAKHPFYRSLIAFYFFLRLLDPQLPFPGRAHHVGDIVFDLPA